MTSSLGEQAVSLQFIVGIVVLLALVQLYRKGKAWKRKIFAFWYTSCQKSLVEGSAPKRKELFEELHRMMSKDPELRKEGPGVVRVLEVGVGPGFNLQFYPKGCRLITLEPNENFLARFRENKAKAPDVLLEKHFFGYGEDMSQIPDDSIDAVVMTYVFCSVTSVEKVLDEIHRVLVPGGKMLFLEHVASQRTACRWAQTIIQPLWKQFTDDCQLLLQAIQLIRRSKLKIDHHYHFSADTLFFLPCIWPHVIGVASKEVEE